MGHYHLLTSDTDGVGNASLLVEWGMERKGTFMSAFSFCVLEEITCVISFEGIMLQSKDTLLLDRSEAVIVWDR